MRAFRVFCTVVAVLGPAVLPAQPPIHVRVLDSLTGTPIRRARIAVSRPTGQKPDTVAGAEVRYANRLWTATGDSVGYLRLDSVPAGEREATVGCRPASGEWLQTRAYRVALPRDRRDTIVIRVDAQMCDQALTPTLPVVVLLAVTYGYHGPWVHLVCPASLRVLPAAWQAIGSRAGAVWLAHNPFQRTSDFRWPTPDTTGRQPRYWLLVDGVLEGPGRYGDRSTSRYRLDVTAVRAAYPMRPAECD
jgi:hypothetical protein